MPTVNFNGYTISDTEIQNLLQAVADFFQANVNVTSGDRNHVPKGGSKTSLHLAKRAADFHVEGIEDMTANLNIQAFCSAIFAKENGYEFIIHGAYTATGGPHLHVGRYGSDSIGYVKFKREGLTAETKNVYELHAKVPLYWTLR